MLSSVGGLHAQLSAGGSARPGAPAALVLLCLPGFPLGGVLGGALEESLGNSTGPSVSAKENSGLRQAHLSLARLWGARLHL